MATMMMAALQSSMASLSISPSSFLGTPLSPSVPYPFAIRIPASKPCTVVMKLKRWERKKCKPNSLPILHKMHVRIGDTVKIIAGREKGKIGEVVTLFKHNSTVIVKDMNLKTKHVKPTQEGESGEIIQIEGAIHSSNVMLYSKEQKVASRVGRKILEDGSRVRYLIKTGEIIDSVDNWKKIFKEGEK